MARDATRRRVLTAAAAALPLVAAGCKGIAALGAPPKPAPDVTVVTAAIAVETQLIARYGDVLAATPGPLASAAIQPQAQRSGAVTSIPRPGTAPGQERVCGPWASAPILPPPPPRARPARDRPAGPGADQVKLPSRSG